MRGVRLYVSLAAAGFALGVGGCDWPAAGTGGLAERREPTQAAVQSAAATIERLRKSGADRFAAADLVEAELVLTRVQRQFAGGLKTAAEIDLASLNTILSHIDQRISAAPGVTAPRRPADGAPNALQ